MMLWKLYVVKTAYHTISVNLNSFKGLTDFAVMEKGNAMANEKRLIDANALIKEAYAEGAYGYVDAKQIADAPTIDAVEVIRCRNCIGRSTWYNDAKYGCAVCGMSGMYPKSEDGFCSYGIRKDGGG